MIDLAPTRTRNYGRLPLHFDIEALREEALSLSNEPGFDTQVQQIGLNHRNEAMNPFTDNIGSLFCYEKNAFFAQETDFNIWNQQLKSSYLFQVFQELTAYCPFQLGRARLMKLEPKNCLSYHFDRDIRIHIPIISNRQAIMFFADAPPVHFPADGSVYWTDTTKFHTAMNGSSTDSRIHLVFSSNTTIVPKSWQSSADRQT